MKRIIFVFNPDYLKIKIDLLMNILSDGYF